MSFGTFRCVPQLVIEHQEQADTIFYTWRLVDRPTVIRLQRFIQDLVARNVLPTPSLYPDDMHMSIIRTENELMNYVPDKQAISVAPIRWQLLGSDPNYYLCLIVEPPERVYNQIELAKKQKATFVFETFLPHISVVQYHTKHIEIDQLNLPDFHIILEGEERHHFNEFM